MVLVKEKVDSEEYGSAECSYSTKFTWKIENFSTIDVLCDYQIHSDVFTGGGDHKWSIVVYPEGDDDAVNHLSVFLDIADGATLPSGWTRRVKYSLSVISEIDELTVSLEEENTFNSDKFIWGHSSFLSNNEIWEIDRRYLVNDTLTVRAEVWFDAENKKDEPKVKRPSSIDEFDTLFRCSPKKLNTHLSSSSGDVSAAQRVIKSCLNMDAASFIRSRRDPEIDKALNVLLNAKVFPQTKAVETVQFLTNFIQSCEKYEVATRYLSEAESANVVGGIVDGLRARLKQLASKFVPARNEVEAIDKDIACYEKWSAEKKAKREQLVKTLNFFADQRITLEKALFYAERELKMSTVEKEEAKKTVAEFHKSWELLKALHSDVNRNVKSVTSGTTRPSMSVTNANYSH